MNQKYCQHKVLQNNMILPNQTTKTLLAITMAMIQGTTMMIVLVQEVFLLKTLELPLRTTCHHQTFECLRRRSYHHQTS